MCGIAGAYQQVDGRAATERMGRCLDHRGPDEEGAFSYADERVDVHFAHRRLSIIDLQHGQQPLVKHPFVLCYNGELYNYPRDPGRAGRRRCPLLDDLGHRSRPRGVAALGTGVPAAVPRHVRLRRARSVDGLPLPRPRPVRDQAPALHPPQGRRRLRLRAQGAGERLRLRAAHAARRHSWHPCSTTGCPTRCARCRASRSCSRARGPSSAPTARTTSSGTGTSSKRQLRPPRSHYDLREVIEDSVNAHLVADVPVSSFLSGGLDSSIVTVLAKQANPQIDAYTITFRAEDQSARGHAG